MRILKSASKIVFILMALSSSIGFFIGILSQENMMVLISLAFTYYFTKKKNENNL